jgi:glycolate oxidase FAD binding subunit
VEGGRLLSLRILGSGTKAWALTEMPPGAKTWTAEGGLLEFWPADQVVVVRAGTRVADLQRALAEHGQCLPLPTEDEHGTCLAGWPGTVGGLVASNLPHGLWSQCGGPRDWILGATLRRADGVRAKSGSRAVKSVAGFDVHRAMVGSWGLLALIESVVLRTWPLGAVPACVGQTVGPSFPPAAWIQRTDRSGFPTALDRAPSVLAFDEPSCTIWTEEEPPRPAVGWLVGPNGRRWSSQPAHPFGSRLKEALDPEARFV